MTRKKVIKVLTCIIIVSILVFSIYNFICFFKTGKLKISLKTNNTYYTDSNISGAVNVRKIIDNETLADIEENYKSVDSNCKIELYNQENKKVKDVQEKINIEKGKFADFNIPIPENLETGSYNLKVTAKSGFYKDSFEMPINIINATNSNIVITLDKGIYKPGDEVNFRALVLSKKDNTPIKQEVSIYIYDGNDNKVYTNKVETSEYGIISGNFKLADEVNSGTYKITVSTEAQEKTKNFTVNPYITPQFEATINTDKDNYLIGETANITISAKYFFGEPVKGAEIKGTINGKEIAGLTNESGEFNLQHVCEENGKVEINCSVTDSSNYMIEAQKTISITKNIFEIEILPEYEEIIKGIENDVYVITKDGNGKPVKTYSDISIGKINKQVISDENGVGKFTITSSETEALLTGIDKNIVTITSKDINENTVTDTKPITISYNTYPVIKTNKLKYNEGEDISVSLKSENDTSSATLYVFKDNQLLKVIAPQDDTIDFNLENVTGIIDIYAKSNNNASKNSKKTIFIKPSQKLNIDIKTDKNEYKPGDTLNIDFKTKDANNNSVDSALLVSILDEAILNLAENDLSIDNLKLALQDIKLSDEITAADVYAMALDEKDENAFRSVLLRQKSNDNSIINKAYVNHDNSEYLQKGLISIAILIVILLIFIMRKLKIKSSIIKTIFNVFAVFLVLSIYLDSFLYEIMYNVSTIIILFIEMVIAIAIYALALYKERDFVFSIVKDLLIIPLIFIFVISALLELLVYYDKIDVDNIANIFLVIFGILILIYIFLIVRLRQQKLGKKLTIVKDILDSLAKAVIFWVATSLVSEIVGPYIGFIIVLCVYILFRKFVFRETKTKLENGKIILNISVNDLISIIIAILALLILIIFSIYIFNNSAQVEVEDSIGSLSRGSVSTDTYDNDFETWGDIDTTYFSTATSSADESKSTTSKIESTIDALTSSNKKQENVQKQDVVKQEKEIEIEKQTETEENVRNVFLESLAFIPELIANDGNAQFNTKISDNITTWNIQAVGNSKDGSVGYNSQTFKVFQELFIDFTLPNNSVVTDKTSIPVTLYNYTDHELSFSINVKENDWCKIGDYSKNINVNSNATQMIYIPIEIIKAGENTLRIEAKAGEITDVVEKSMNVNVNGLEKEEVALSGIIDEDYEQDLIFDDDAIDGTKKIKVKLYPSSITEVMENMDSMLRMPTGCFEQTSSSLYPDILILEYLRKNNINNQIIEEKALNYISKGYQKLLTYEVRDEKGGYSLYGYSPAEPVITAFGLMEMNELSKVYDVDEKVIENMQNYLFKKQKSNGSFEIGSTYIGGTESSDNLAMNAYIAWALSEACPEDKRIEKTVNYLEKKLDDISDTYTLALMANVYANIDEKDKAKDIIKELLEKVTIDNTNTYLVCKSVDYYGTRGRYQNVQTTALTSMALTKLKENDKTNNSFIEYLKENKDIRGTWGTTQSTILALKAINMYEQDTKLKEQTLTVSLNGEEKEVQIKEDNLDIYEFEFDNVSVENKIKLGVKKGKINYEIIKEYYQDYSKLENDNKISISQTITTNAKVNDIISQNITILNNNIDIENGLLQINIPQGCSVEEDSLLQLKHLGIIEKYEYNYERINIYVRNFKEQDSISISINYRALYPETITGASMRFYDYYNPDVEAICNPVGIAVTQ